MSEIVDAINFFKCLDAITCSQKIWICMDTSFRVLYEGTLGMPTEEGSWLFCLEWLQKAQNLRVKRFFLSLSEGKWIRWPIASLKDWRLQLELDWANTESHTKHIWGVNSRSYTCFNYLLSNHDQSLLICFFITIKYRKIEPITTVELEVQEAGTDKSNCQRTIMPVMCKCNLRMLPPRSMTLSGLSCRK